MVDGANDSSTSSLEDYYTGEDNRSKVRKNDEGREREIVIVMAIKGFSLRVPKAV